MVNDETTRHFATVLVAGTKGGVFKIGEKDNTISQKIECIKLVRLHDRSVGLREGKDLIDELWEN